MDGWDNDGIFAAAIVAVFAAVGFLRVGHWLRHLGRGRRRTSSLHVARHATPWRRGSQVRTQSRPQQGPFTLRRFWVVDGDTIQDNATSTTYRLESIECPETDTRAKCYRERTMGERAKFEAIRLLKGAATITVRPTGQIDPYGRSIASIDVDGQDFGQLMIARGFARPWRGVREDWCGPNGGLARMAEACSAKFHCKTCGGRAGVIDPQNVVSFPAIDRTSAETPAESSEAGQSPAAPPQSGN